MAQWEVLDISSVQSSLNYDDIVNSDIDGVVLRLGCRKYDESAALTKDTELETHYEALQGRTKLGYYWVSQALTEEEAIEEAEYCHQLLDGRQCDFPVYLYSGWSNESHNGRGDYLNKHYRMRTVYAWAYKMIELGYRAGVYADDTWYRSQLLVSYLYDAGFSIWVSKYSPYGPSYSTKYDAWNYTDEGVKGENTFLDLSYFYTNVADWPEDTRIDISDIEGHLDPDYLEYNGSYITPTPIIDDLVEGEDFIVTYYNNFNTGIAVCSCEGINDFYGVLNLTFVIYPRHLDGNYEIELAKHSYDYTSTHVIPDYSIEGLTPGRDYTILCENNIAPGEATIYATGKGNYIGTISTNYIIYINEDMETKTLILTPESMVYNAGLPCEPQVTIFGLRQGVDFTVSYANNINVGTATVTATGLGRYTGSKTQEFEIKRCFIGAVASYVVLDDYYYTGEQITPPIVIEGLTEGVDYRVEYGENINVEYGVVILYGLGNYFGDFSKYFRILPQPIDDRTLIITPLVNEYTGEPVKPHIEVEGLVEDQDFLPAYTNNIERGTEAIAMAIGIGNYGSAAVDYFTIIKGRMEDKEVTFDPDTWVYTGYPITPTPSIHGLTVGIDFDIDSYTDNILPGVASVVCTGINNYEGSVVGHFNIVGRSIEDMELVLESSSFIYDGTAKTPRATIAGLVQGTDFTITYVDNIDAGVGKVIATGINTYRGTLEANILIERASIEGLILNISPTTFVFNGRAHTPSVTLAGLLKNTDYDVNIANNINAGTATVVCNGINNYNGTVIGSFTITPATILDISFILNPTIFDYDGTPKCPTVSTFAPLEEDIDYTVSYRNNTNAGVAFADITGIGNYKDTLQNPFTIKALPINTGEYEIEDIPDQEYTGNNQPEIIIEGLRPVTDYTSSYTNNTSIGTATAIATGANNFMGTLQKDFQIVQASIRRTLVKLGTPTIYSKYRIDGPIVITYEGNTLVEGVDYQLTERIEEDFGDFTLVTFNGRGLGNFNDERTYRFRVIPTDPGRGPVYPEYYDADDGTNIDSHGRRKGEDLDYTDDELIDINTVGMFIRNSSMYYDFGRECIADFVTDLVIDQDYEPHYSDNIDVGVANVYVLGKGEYTGKRDFIYAITPRPINNNITIDCGEPDEKGHYDISDRKIYYTGQRELVRNVEFTDSVTYQTDTSTGIVYAVITVTGMGSFTGAYTGKVDVDSIYESIDYYDFYLLEPEYYYNHGEPITPIAYCRKLLYGIDYQISGYENNIEVGIGVINLVGIGDYKGTARVEFNIKPAYVNNCTIDIGEIVDEQYNPDLIKVITPDGYELVKGTDVNVVAVNYTIEDLKIADVTATGINNYTGEVNRKFYLNDSYLDINNTDVRLITTEYVYSGLPMYPMVVSNELIEGLDYSITYDDYAIIAGTYRVTINGLGNYRGSTKLLDFYIRGMDISLCRSSCGEPDEYGFYNPENFVITNPYEEELVEGNDYILEITYAANFEDMYKDVIFNVTGINNYADSTYFGYRYSNLDESDKPVNPSTIEEIEVRMPINLEDAPVYARSTSAKYDDILNGIYFIYDDIIEFDRIRIVKSKYAFENPCMFTGWVDIEKVLVSKNRFKVDDKVIVTGTTYQYENGTGMQMEKDGEIMYITYCNEKEGHGAYNYGLSSELHTAIQAYCNESVLKHAVPEESNE